MRSYQAEIISALINKRNWMGSNTNVETKNDVTEVTYYRTKIAVVNHSNKTAKFDNGGWTNAATSARINAVKEFCNDYGYTY